MNVPVLLIGIFGLIVGLAVCARLAAATDLFRRDVEQRGHPREIVTRGTVLIGALAVCAVGIYCIVIGVMV